MYALQTAVWMEAPRDVPLRPGSRPVLFSGGRPLPASCYMLADLAGFTSRHQSGQVRSVVAHSLPARFEILIVRALVTSLHDCIVSMQALAFAGSFHFAKSGPPPSYRNARSRDRERGLSKLSGVDELYMYMFILRGPIGSFSDWHRYGPARAHSGAPLLFGGFLQHIEFGKRNNYNHAGVTIDWPIQE